MTTKTIRWIRCYEAAIIEADLERYEAQAALHGIDLSDARAEREGRRQGQFSPSSAVNTAAAMAMRGLPVEIRRVQSFDQERTPS